MRTINTILAIIYGMLFTSSLIYILTHIEYILPNRIAAIFWIAGLISWPAHYAIIYKLDDLNKEIAALTSWYSVILPILYSVIIGIVVGIIMIKTNIYDNRIINNHIGYIAIAIYDASFIPYLWYSSMIMKYREIRIRDAKYEQ